MRTTIGTTIAAAMTTSIDAALYRLMTWLSPSYPVGAYSYSHGIEYAVEAGLVRDRETLTDWVAQAVTHGAGLVDAALFAAAWRGDDVVGLADAWRGSAEMALESRAQGRAFLVTTRAAWAHPALEELALRTRGEVSFPVAVGVAARAHGIPLDAALVAYLHAFAGNLVSAGIRLIPLGQTEGQRAIAALEPAVASAAAVATTVALDDIGTAAPMLDWCSMKHETQYTRLFRS